MARKLLCEIISPEQVVYSGEVDMVIAKGADGELGLLPLHTPLVTLLDIGVLRVKYDGRQEYVAIDGGYLEIREDRVTVLADGAEIASEIDVERARQAKERAEREIAAAREKGEDFFEAQQELRRALTRLSVAEKR